MSRSSNPDIDIDSSVNPLWETLITSFRVTEHTTGLIGNGPHSENHWSIYHVLAAAQGRATNLSGMIRLNMVEDEL